MKNVTFLLLLSMQACFNETTTSTFHEVEKDSIPPTDTFFVDSNVRNDTVSSIDGIVNNLNDNDTTIDPQKYINWDSSEGLRVWFGSIQNSSINKYIFPMGYCNAKRQFITIWIPKNKKRYTSETIDEEVGIFSSSKEEEYSIFNIAIFEMPMTPLAEIEDEFDMGLVYPSLVKVFVRMDGRWKYKGSRRVNNFEDFTVVEMETVNAL